MENSENKKQASITVAFSLIFLLVLSFLMGLLESARVYGLQVRAKQAVSGGMSSLFSMYHRPLFDRYGLLFLEEKTISQGLELKTLEVVLIEQMLADCMPNLGLFQISTAQYFTLVPTLVETSGKYTALDDNGRFFVRDVLEFMKYYEVAHLANTSVTYLAGLVQGQQAREYLAQGEAELESEDWNVYATTQSEETSQEASSSEETKEDVDIPLATSEAATEEEREETTGEDMNQKVQDAIDQSVLGEFQDLLNQGLLELYGVDTEHLSDHRMDLSKSISSGHKEQSGLASPIGGITEEGLYNEYILSFFSSYITGMNNAPLNYEIEYILAGNNNDKDNLSEVLHQIYLSRLSMNSLALLRMKERETEAKEMAIKLVGFMGIAPLTGAVTWSLLEMMAVTESVLDMRAILQGKKVPFMKSKSDWTTTLPRTIELLKSDSMAKESKLGVGYQGYLRMLLYTLSSSKKVYRSMDLIEWNIRKEDTSFYLENCIYALEVSVLIQAEPLFTKAFSLFPKGTVPTKYTWNLYEARIY